jgi:hypothetical protein
MNLLLENDLEPLLDERPGPCISLYLSTSGIGTRALQGPIQLKNLLRQARVALQAKGLEPIAIDTLLGPLADLTADLSFWNTQEEGTALFRSPGFTCVFHVPCAFAQRCVIGDHFFLKPLLPLVARGETFYVLALSQNETRLLEATCRTVRRLGPEDLPRSLVEALGEVKTAQYLQYHTAAPGRPGAQVSIYHGQGVGEGDVKEELRRYLRQVESAMRKLLAGRTAPLVLAGAEPLPSLYREVTAYPHLVVTSVPGNPERLSDGELRDRAWALLAPAWREERLRAAERFADLAATRRASSDVSAILPAARDGRVETLLLACDAELWGRLDGRAETVQVHTLPEEGDEELLDAAARLSLRHGGTVYGMDRGEVPGGGELAAVFRY